jgi:maltooligosyltrehalose trehalohydrolase
VRGAPAFDAPAHQFVCFLENHDQIANSATSRRLPALTSPAWWRAMSAFLLLGPWTPLLFQGQEWGAAQPFKYFADHRPDLQAAVLTGRREFLSQFSRAFVNPLIVGVPDDIGADAFESSRLIRPSGNRASLLYEDLLRLRRDDPSLGQHAPQIVGATAGERTVLLRFTGSDPAEDRLLVLNLGPDLNLAPLAQPIVAAPEGHQWSALWCSEHIQYGGSGVCESAPPVRLVATGHATTVFAPAHS